MITSDMRDFEEFLQKQEQQKFNDYCQLVADRLFDYNRVERTKVILSASLMFNKNEKPELFFNEIGNGFMRRLIGDLTPEQHDTIKSLVIEKAKQYLQ